MKRSRRFEANASTAHGQSIFWGRGEGAVQGLTELTECMRCDDAWLREVQDEIRNGQLSMNNYYFLHGMPTTVPGSWCNGKAQRNNDKCKKMKKVSLKQCIRSVLSAEKTEHRNNLLR